MSDEWEEEDWGDDPDADDESTIPCPDCGADLYADVDACPECGYWLTEADRAAAWRADSASGRVVRFGWWMIAAAVVGGLWAWLS